jgi:hypothetical protein
MSGFQKANTPRSCSVARTFGELPAVAAHDHVVVDAESRNYNFIGQLYCEHALPLKTTMPDDPLTHAIEASQAIFGAGQLGLWSDTTTVAFVAGQRRPQRPR